MIRSTIAVATFAVGMLCITMSVQGSAKAPPPKEPAKDVQDYVHSHTVHGPANHDGYDTQFGRRQNRS